MTHVTHSFTCSQYPGVGDDAMMPSFQLSGRDVRMMTTLHILVSAGYPTFTPDSPDLSLN